MAVATGFEPAISALTGQRVNQTTLRDLIFKAQIFKKQINLSGLTIAIFVRQVNEWYYKIDLL